MTMNELDMDGGGGMEALRDTLVSLLPTLMILMMAMVIALFSVTNIIPYWREHEQITTDLNDGRDALQQKNVENNPQIRMTTLQGQIDSIQADLDTAGHTLLTDDQAKAMLDQLYIYASESAVTITSLKVQQVDTSTTKGKKTVTIGETPYQVRTYQMEVNGSVPQLLRFIVMTKEISSPAVVINKLTIQTTKTSSTLVTDLMLYTSAYASGEALNDLPEIALPEFVESESISETNGAPVVESQTSVQTVAQTTLQGTPQPANTVASAAPVTTTAICANAPATLFQVGSIAVVDFSEKGSLNMLSAPRTAGAAVYALTLARDGDRLQIIAGPVCGQWQGLELWYWQVNRDGTQGWVGEATTEDRWLCPVDNPQCSS